MAMAVQEAPAAESETEHLLQRLGVDYGRLRVRVDSIDYETSLAIQARRERLDPQVVADYVEAMARGDVFPPIVVCDVPDKRRPIAPAGVHRLAAAREVGALEIDTFFVAGATSAQIERIATEDNLRHGSRVSIDDRLWQAERLISRTGITQVAAADRLRIPVSRLQTFLRQRGTEERLHRMGLAPIRSKDARERLHSVRSDVVFRAIAGLPEELLGAAAVARLVTEINGATSEADQLAIVAAAKEQSQLERRMDVPAAKSGGPGNSSAYAIVTRIVNGSKGWARLEERVREIPLELQPKCRADLLRASETLRSIANEMHP